MGIAAGGEGSHQFEFKGQTQWPPFGPLNFPPPKKQEVVSDRMVFMLANRAECDRLGLLPIHVSSVMDALRSDTFSASTKLELVTQRGPQCDAYGAEGGVVAKADWKAGDVMLAKHIVSVAPDSAGEVLPYLPRAHNIWEFCERQLPPGGYEGFGKVWPKCLVTANVCLTHV